MEDGGWKLECAHSSDLRRQPRIDRGRERGGGETKNKRLITGAEKKTKTLRGSAPPLAHALCSRGGQSITGWPGGPPWRARGAGAQSQRKGWLPSPLLAAARRWVPFTVTVSWQGCHPPEVLAGVIPEHGFSSSSIPPTGDRQLCQLPWLLRFALVWKVWERLSAILPPHQVTSAQGQLSQPFPATKSRFFFFSFSLLSQGVGWGDWQGSAGKRLSHARGRGAGPVPHPSRGRGATGMGSGVAGRDGMAGVYCGSGLRWVGCREEKAHTDLTGAPSPHPTSVRVAASSPAASGPSLLRASGAGGGASVLPSRVGRFAWLCQAGAQLPERSCISP